MASGTISFNGAISGLDTEELVTKLMEVESTKLDKLNEKKDTLNEKADAWRELNSLLYTLQESVYDLQSLSMFMGRTVTVSDSDVLTATTSDGALVANYSIEVNSLAQSQTVASQEFSSGALGYTGTFTIGSGENTYSIEVTETDTLSSIASKINSIAGEDVYASVVQVNESSNSSEIKYQLVITDRSTGEANASVFTDSSDDENGILYKLGIKKMTIDENGNSQIVTNVTQAATNASITYNGITVERSTNTITDAISGVTLNLVGEGTSTVKVTEDKDAIVETVQSFVDSYNAVMDFINENTTYTYDADTETGTAGPLFGDSTLSYIQSQLKSYLSQTVSDVSQNMSSLVMIGITSASGIDGAKSGNLEFDEDTFRDALDENYEDVGKLFGSIGGAGVFSDMYDQLFDWTSSTGTISDKTDAIDSEIDELNDRIDDMENYLEEMEERYYSQFTAMELALAQLQTQTSAITALLSNDSNG